MTGDGVDESLEYGEIMVADGGDIAAQAEESFCARSGAKAARDFLSDFEHAQDSLCMIVGEGDAEVAEESEHRDFVTAHAVQEVDGLAHLWTAAADDGRTWRRGIGGTAKHKQGVVAPEPGGRLGWGEPDAALCLEFVNALVHVQEEPAHFHGPILVESFREEGQLPQEVGVAETVEAGPLEIRGEAIVDQSSMKAGKDGEMLHGLSAAPGMEAVPSQEPGAEGMDPLKLGFDAQSRFVGMKDLRRWQQGSDPDLKILQV